MEVTNRFKGLDLTECRRAVVGGSLHSTGGSDQNYPQEKEMQRDKMVVKEALQIAEKRREMKGKR